MFTTSGKEQTWAFFIRFSSARREVGERKSKQNKQIRIRRDGWRCAGSLDFITTSTPIESTQPSTECVYKIHRGSEPKAIDEHGENDKWPKWMCVPLWCVIASNISKTTQNHQINCMNTEGSKATYCFRINTHTVNNTPHALLTIDSFRLLTAFPPLMGTPAFVVHSGIFGECYTVLNLKSESHRKISAV